MRVALGGDGLYLLGFAGVGVGVGLAGTGLGEGLADPSFPGGFGGSGSWQTAARREAGAIKSAAVRMARSRVFMVSAAC